VVVDGVQNRAQSHHRLLIGVFEERGREGLAKDRAWFAPQSAHLVHGNPHPREGQHITGDHPGWGRMDQSWVQTPRFLSLTTPSLESMPATAANQ
jgi:hypothetical protein